MVSCDAFVRSGVPFLPGLTMVPQNEEPDMPGGGSAVDGLSWGGSYLVDVAINLKPTSQFLPKQNHMRITRTHTHTHSRGISPQTRP